LASLTANKIFENQRYNSYMKIVFDELGPAKIVQLYAPQIPFRAVVVVDNTARGPAIGGVRVSPEVDLQEVYRLARTMTFKSAVADLPHGGGKAGIIADPEDPNLERIFRTFARMIGELSEYIPAPDMGCHEEAMAWVQDEIGRVAGLPEELGGLPLDKLGATGYGLAECAAIACDQMGLKLSGARVAIQGFGSVGKAAAKFLASQGAVVVAASDSQGGVHSPAGMPVAQLLAAKKAHGTVTRYGEAEVIGKDDIFKIDCDILIPAATPDVINERNVGEIKARLILEGANIPATPQAERMLAERGVRVVPDFIANAGGLIMAAMEYAGKSEAEAFAAISEKIRANTQRILEKAKNESLLPREAAERIARERVKKAMRYRAYSYS
jgi:glutamate dehydrogenase/leucine dehydrogenase